MNNADKGIVLKIFSQENCRPCQILKAVIESEREDLEAQGVTIEHVDITPGIRDDRAEIIEKYGIMSTPVTAIERNGHKLAQVAGMVNIGELYDMIEHSKTAK